MTEQRRTGLHFKSALLPHGWAADVRLEFTAGRISKIEQGVEAAADDERGAVGLPGMPNLHSHAFQRGMAGLAERRGPTGDNFWTWREVMYRFVERVGPEELEAIAALAYLEMVEAGFTRVGEFHYLHHDFGGRPYDDLGETAARLGAAAQAVGIGLTLLPVFYAHGGFGGQDPGDAQRRFVNTPDRYARLVEASRQALRSLPGASVGIAPHSLRAVTPVELDRILPIAAGAPIHIHVAEQVREVEDCVAWSGARPVEWLFDNAPVDASWCLVHATHMAEAEVERLARSGAVAGLCPITEGNLGDGLFPLAAYRGQGGALGIGTDSNVLIDLPEELRLLEYGQRLKALARNVAADSHGGSTGRALFDAALAGGAQALGVEPGLRAGAAADILSLDADHPALTARSGDDLLDSFIFAGRNGMISDVWIRGRRVVAQGAHHSRAEIAARYRTVLARLLAP